MTLTQLRYFLAACRFGTFTSAADHLGISQPSLSQQVILLERGLGVSLFVRAGRQLVLTDAGKALLEHASRIVADVDMAATAVGAVRGMEDGTASLGTFGVAYFYFVREVIAEFAARHPGVRMRVVGQNTVEVVELVKSGELEAGLITLPTDTTGLVVRPVMRDENMFVALEGPTTREPMSIERLATIDLIMYDAHFGWRDPTRAQLAARAAAAGVTLSPRIEVEQAESALALASRGFGGTFVLETVARTAAFPPMLKAIPFEPPLYDTFAFVWRKGFRLSPATAELIALARDRMRTFSHAIQLVGDLRMERR